MSINLGNGSDGIKVFTSNTTLTTSDLNKIWNYSSFHIKSGVTVTLDVDAIGSVYYLRCLESLIVEGTLILNNNYAGDSETLNSILFNQKTVANGGNGGAGGSATSEDFGTPPPVYAGGLAGSAFGNSYGNGGGGGGGANGQASNGYDGGVNNASYNLPVGGYYSPTPIAASRSGGGGGAFSTINFGRGGNGIFGVGGTSGNSAGGGGGGAGGRGGKTGLNLYIEAKRIFVSGNIQCSGTNGGSGGFGGTGAFTYDAGGGGGGGGGGGFGGDVTLNYSNQYIVSGSVLYAGGSAGSGNLGGSKGGGFGNDGNTGNTGTAGTTGSITITKQPWKPLKNGHPGSTSFII